LLDLSFGSPRLLKRKNGAEDLVFAAPSELWGLNPETGKLRWYVETGLTGNVSPDAVFAGDLICVFGGYPSIGRVGVKLSDNNKGEIIWRDNNSTYVPTPVVHDKNIYWVSDQGFANAIDAASGKALYKERLGGGSTGRGRGKPFYASQVIVGDKVYAVSRRQGTFVIAAKPTFEVLATNLIEGDDTDFNATPAVSDGCLFLRSNKALYCVGK
jgi:outer membrane protein assembly factor BamB